MKVIIIKLIRLLTLAFIPALIITACGSGDSREVNGNGEDPVSGYSVSEINSSINTPITRTQADYYCIFFSKKYYIL